MKITNKYSLPEPLYRAISYDSGPRTGFSVTDLIQPPRMTQLTRRHWDEIEVDASELIWKLLGSSVHFVLAHAMKEAATEKTLRAEIAGVEVSGRFDYRLNHAIHDYKLTSVWNVIFDPKGRAEYHPQLNSYAYLNYLVDGTIIDELIVWPILRDWQANKLRTEPGYPPIPIVKIDIPVWPLEKTKAYLESRVKMHKVAETLPDDQLPLCTGEDMWQKKEQWAVMKPGQKRAVRLFDTENAACNCRNQLPFGGVYVVRREGTRARCERFCDVNRWCNQYADYKKAK